MRMHLLGPLWGSLAPGGPGLQLGRPGQALGTCQLTAPLSGPCHIQQADDNAGGVGVGMEVGTEWTLDGVGRAWRRGSATAQLQVTGHCL